MAVAAVTKADDVALPIDSIVPPPVNQAAKAIRAANFAAMFCCAPKGSDNAKRIVSVALHKLGKCIGHLFARLVVPSHAEYRRGLVKITSYLDGVIPARDAVISKDKAVGISKAIRIDFGQFVGDWAHIPQGPEPVQVGVHLVFHAVNCQEVRPESIGKQDGVLRFKFRDCVG